ncbi:ABC transporter permease [Citricoccus sp. NPDC079358]|uniref:ABC transporter permease n=1 Tax=Citricoccus sp. NPDC079358 TaxID=3154653 RepID=UPI00344B6280
MTTLSSNITSIIKLTRTQCRIEFAREIRPMGLVGLLLPVVLVSVLLWLGLEDWLGGPELFGWIIASYLAVAVAITGILTLSSTIIAEQEDGTLLRAKTLPGGFAAHILARLTVLTTKSLVSALIVIATVFIGTSGRVFELHAGLLLLIPFSVLAVAVTSPLGIVAGGFSKKLTGVLYISAATYALVAISHIFFPASFMPSWLTVVAAVFPLLWLGYIARGIMVTDDAVLQMFGTPSPEQWMIGIAVLVIWFLVGVFFSPRALRALSRRQSGRRLEPWGDRKVRQQVNEPVSG